MLKTTPLFAVIATLILIEQSFGGVVITTSDLPLEANKANQTVTFQIATDTGTCELSQFDLRLMIGDGGSFFGGVDVPVGQPNPTVPAVIDIDLDLLFGAGATSANSVFNTADIYAANTAIAAIADAEGESGASGKQTITTSPVDLFSLEFSTAGLKGGTTFAMSFVLDDGTGSIDRTTINSQCATSFSDISFPTVGLVAVPEPSALTYLALLAVVLAGRKRFDNRNNL